MLTNVTKLQYIVSKNGKFPNIWKAGLHKYKNEKSQKVVENWALNRKA
jgi:hypothetical protein